MSAGIEVKLDTAKMVLAAQTIRNQMSIVNNCFMTIKEEALGLKGNCWEGESADAYYENMKKLCDEQSKQDAVSTGFIVKTLDDYIQNLHKEYHFLRQKYNLTPLQPELWKFLRLRPSNFPTIRLMQFVKLLNLNSFSLSNILFQESLNEVLKMLNPTPSIYWETHFKPGVVSVKKSKTFGKSSAILILINTVIPMMFAYGKLRGIESYSAKALDWLQEIKPEKNDIISEWEQAEIKVSNAMESQALVHLTKNYCLQKKCLHCRIGHLVMTNL